LHNVAAIGPERLASILVDLAEADAEVKRRLRLELAAQVGGDTHAHNTGAIGDIAKTLRLRPVIQAEASRLSFFRLSFALLIIGVYWMVVRLYEYVDWWRGGKKALLFIALIACCVAIYVTDQIYAVSRHRKRAIDQIYWISILYLLTCIVIYMICLIVAEPPLSHHPGWPDILSEVRGRLKLEGIVIIFITLTPFGAALGRTSIQKISQYLPIYLGVFAIICVLARCIIFFYYTCGAGFADTPIACHGFYISDIGGTTLNAIHAVQRGINPYSVDIQDGLNPDSAYHGYRYWPMMIAPYMPLAVFFGQNAIRLTNFGLDIIAAVMIAVVVRRRSGWPCGVLATSLYLMLPIMSDTLYLGAATDLVPIVFLLRALALYETRPGLAGAMVGLSVSAKLFPGLLMLICCFPEFRRLRYIGGFFLGLIPTIAFCLLAPSDFINNTVTAILRMPLDPTSWLYGRPSYVIGATKLAFILLIAIISLRVILQPPNLLERCTIYIICVVATLLVTHAHNNYMIWWIPFFCILLSSPLSRILCLPSQPLGTRVRHA
jgi:hypothetical protein